MARPLKLDTVPLPTVQPDSPTSRTHVEVPVPQQPATALPQTIDEALASKDRAINNRVPRGLWDLVAARADELGVNLRPFLTDALVRALEGDVETHRDRIDETERRQAYARIASR